MQNTENSSSSDIGLIDSNEVRRGRWVVSNISERNQIQKKKRAVGIKAYVISENKEYILINDPDSDLTTNADWKLQAYLDNNNKIPIENLPMDAMFKTGMCLIWLLGIDQIPNGWNLCDGTNGTPDMRGKFVLMVNDKYPLLSTGGEESHALTETEMPSHNHGGKTSGTDNHYHYITSSTSHWSSERNTLTNERTVTWVGRYGSDSSHNYELAGNDYVADRGKSSPARGDISVNISSSGGNQAHNNMPPYIAVNFIMKIDI